MFKNRCKFSFVFDVVICKRNTENRSLRLVHDDGSFSSTRELKIQLPSVTQGGVTSLVLKIDFKTYSIFSFHPINETIKMGIIPWIILPSTFNQFQSSVS